MSPKELTPFEHHVIINKGTESPFSGLYTDHTANGTYHCKACEAPLFLSKDKFASHCGWPSFDDEIDGAIKRLMDRDGKRTEIVCKNCSGHLGHVFVGEALTSKNLRHCVNSVSMTFKPAPNPHAQSIVLASGCFWGTQYFLGRIPGVLRTEVGYIGGHVDHPTYEEVCQKKSGHVEAVLVEYDSSKVSLAEIIMVFFETHNFSQENGQGPDIGPQYLSVAFYENQEQKQIIDSVIAELHKMKLKVATTVRPKTTFWPGEDYHQNYYEAKGDTPYCHSYKKPFSR